MGIPFAIATTLAIWFLWSDMPGTIELPSLMFGACIAGIAAAGLPQRDQLCAVIAAPVLSYYFIMLFPTQDSPLGPTAGASSAGFALGALLALARSLIKRRRPSRSAS